MKETAARAVIFNYGCDRAYLSMPYLRINRLVDYGWNALDLCQGQSSAKMKRIAKQALDWYPEDIRQAKQQAAIELGDSHP